MLQWKLSDNLIKRSGYRSTTLSLQWLDCWQVTPRQQHSCKIQAHANEVYIVITFEMKLIYYSVIFTKPIQLTMLYSFIAELLQKLKR